MDFQLDHMIILIPYAYLSDPPTWLTDNFIISPGGRHADGKTENRLILFEDGTYIELIAFVHDDPANRQGHWWDKPYGIVDFALTSPNDIDFDAINERLQSTRSDISYATPQAGGRTRPDGVELKWAVTFPKGIERGAVPFWCQDRTPRDRRVPVTDANSQHSSGALGVKTFHIEVDAERLTALEAATAAILDQPVNQQAEYEVGRPSQISRSPAGPKIRLTTASSSGHQTAAETCLRLSMVLQIEAGHSSSPRDILADVGGEGVVRIAFDST